MYKKAFYENYYNKAFAAIKCIVLYYLMSNSSCLADSNPACFLSADLDWKRLLRSFFLPLDLSSAVFDLSRTSSKPVSSQK